MRSPAERSVFGRRLTPAGILALAFALRLWRLGDKNLWWDEALALWAVRKPLAALSAWTAGDVHPPLFFWSLWLWRRGVGETEFALRLLPAIWGVISVALAWLLGRRAGGRRAGALAALLAAVSPFAVWWSGELRMYALAGLWVALAAYAVQRWLAAAEVPGRGSAAAALSPQGLPSASRGRPEPWLLVYLLAAVALLHSLYLGAAALVALNLAVGLAGLRRALPRGRLAQWSGAQLLAVLAFLPWWRYASGRMQSWSSIRQPAGLGQTWLLDATLLATGRSTALAEAAWPTGLFWAATLLAAVLAWRRVVDRRRSAVLVGLVLLPPLAIWAATQPRALFYSPGLEARYFLPFAIPVYALAALLAASAGTGRGLRPRARRLLLAAGLLLPLLGGLPGHFGPRRLRDDLQSLVLVLWSQARPDDALLLVSGDRYPLLEAAYGRWTPAGTAGLPAVRPFPGKAAGPLPAGWERDLAAIARDHPRVWLVEVERHWQDPEGRVASWLAARRRTLLAESFGPHRLSLFAASNAAPPAVERIDPTWPGCRAAGGGAELLACQPALEVRAGDDLSLTLFGRRGLPGGLRLESADDAAAGPVARWTAPAVDDPSAALRQRFTLAVDERLPGGRYAFVAEDADAPLGRSVQVDALLPQPGAWPDRWRRTDLRFDDPAGEIRLAGVGLSGPPPAPGATVAVDLRWELPAGLDPAAGPTVFVHLLGAARPDGSVLWASGDGRPLGDRWPETAGPLLDRHLLSIGTDAPPGPYQVEIGLYDVGSGERRPVTGPGSDAAARRFLWQPGAAPAGGP